MTSFYLLLLFVLFINNVDIVSSSCSANVSIIARPGASWDAGNYYPNQIFDILVENNGTETITSLLVLFTSSSYVATPIQAWNYNIGTGLFSNFYQIAPKSEWRGSGMISAVPQLQADVVFSNCQNPCNAAITGLYNPRMNDVGYYITVTNIGTQVITSLQAFFSPLKVIVGYNYINTSGDFTSFHNLFPGQSHTLTAIRTIAGANNYRDWIIAGNDITPTCKPVPPTHCQPSNPQNSPTCNPVMTKTAIGPFNGTQLWKLTITNNGNTPITKINVQITKTDQYKNVAVSSISGFLKLYSGDPTPDCIRCLFSNLGQYIVLIPDYICPGDSFDAAIIQSGGEDYDSFSAYISDYLCFNPL